MKYLIYISSAVRLMSELELSEILRTSRKKNEALNITGMLICGDGTFIQLLEGDVDEIDEAFKQIEKDTLHKNVIKLIEANLDERNFPDWSMAFFTIEPEAMEQLEGYINPASKNFLQTDNPHPAITILKVFAANNKMANG